MFSVRSTQKLEQQLREGTLELPQECAHNRDVVLELLPYVAKALPTFTHATDWELSDIADCVAYLMRTDILRSHGSFRQLRFCAIPVFYFDDGLKAHLRNDPNELSEDWIPFWQQDERYPHYKNIWTELFRCFSETVLMMPHLRTLDRLEIPQVHMANVTTFLLNPVDVTDYRYSSEEVALFNQRMHHCFPLT